MNDETEEEQLTRNSNETTGENLLDQSYHNLLASSLSNSLRIPQVANDGSSIRLSRSMPDFGETQDDSNQRLPISSILLPVDSDPLDNRLDSRLTQNEESFENLQDVQTEMYIQPRNVCDKEKEDLGLLNSLEKLSKTVLPSNYSFSQDDFLKDFDNSKASEHSFFSEGDNHHKLNTNTRNRDVQNDDFSDLALEEKVVTITLSREPSSRNLAKKKRSKSKNIRTTDQAYLENDGGIVKEKSKKKHKYGRHSSNEFCKSVTSDEGYVVTKVTSVQSTGRRSAPVFSRKAFCTPEFWNKGYTTFNKYARQPSNEAFRKRTASGISYGSNVVSGGVPVVNKTSQSSSKYGSFGASKHSSHYKKLNNRVDGYASESAVVQSKPFLSKGAERSKNIDKDVKLKRNTDFEGKYTDKRFATELKQNIDDDSVPTVIDESKSTVSNLQVVIPESNSSSESSDDESTCSSDEKSPLLKKSSSSEVETAVYPQRWYLLFLFSFFALVWNAIWSTWGPIAQSAKLVFNWTDGNIAMFTWLGNVPFLITMFPIAYLMDVKGMRIAMVLCCGLTFLGSGLRCITTNPTEATWLIYAGQLLNGIAGTVPISGPGLISGLWFPPHQRATATAASTIMGYLGSCISFVIGPLLVPEPASGTPFNSSQSIHDLEFLFNKNSSDNGTDISAQRNGIMYILYSECAAAGLVFLLVLMYFPSKPPLPPSISASIPREKYMDGLKMIVRNKQFWVTAIAYSFPIGVYEVWQVVLDVNLYPRVSQTTAGWMDFYATIGGCASGLLISRFADYFSRQMKLFLLVFYSLSAISMLWFSFLVSGILPFDTTSVYAAIVIGGVFLDGGAPLFFELVIEVSYPVGEGVTSGCLQWICASAGLMFLSLLQIESIGKEWMNWCFLGCISLAIPLLFFINTTYGRADIDDIEIDVESDSSDESSSSSGPSEKLLHSQSNHTAVAIA